MLRIVFLFLLLLPISLHSQVLSGTVHENGIPLEHVQVSIHSLKSNAILKFATTNSDGYYSIKLDVIIDTLIVEANSIKHDQAQEVIYLNQNQTVNFNLNRRSIPLKEVVIAQRRFATIKKDTIVFNPQNYTDGTEKVVEDVLRKLPGIKIEADGEVKFKGRAIKKLLLDGDDLFSDQYVLGSRNIDAAMLDKVEAIENYNNNPLLSGIRDTDDIAINLKLKKGKTDFSTNIDFGIGYKEKVDVKVTELMINSKSKGFSVNSFNNVGKNPSQYSYAGDVVQRGSEKITATELLRHGNFYSDLEERYRPDNSTLLNSANFLTKIKKVVIKAGMSFYNDRLNRENEASTNVKYGTDEFKFLTLERAVRSSKIINGSLELSENVSNSLNWQYQGTVLIKAIDFNSLSNNNEIRQINRVTTNSFATSQMFVLTKKIDSTNAISSSLSIAKAVSPQEYSITPGMLINNIQHQKNDQYSSFDKSQLQYKTEWFAKYSTVQLYMRGSYLFQSNKYKSNLTAQINDSISADVFGFMNDMIYKSHAPSLYATLSYNLTHKLKVLGGVQSTFFKVVINDIHSDKTVNKSDPIFSPFLKFQMRMSSKSSLLFSYVYSNNVTELANLFQGSVLSNYRTSISNESRFDFLNSANYSAQYRYYDFITLSNFSISLAHNRLQDNYFSKFNISSNNTSIVSFLAQFPSEDYIMALSAEKYIDMIKSTLFIDLLYSISKQKNIVNESDIRDISFHNFSLEAILRRGGRNKLYIENKAAIVNEIYHQDNTTNSAFRVKNIIKLVYKPRPTLNISSYYTTLITNIKASLINNLWDINVSYIPTNKRIEYTLSANNLLNNRMVKSTDASSISTSIYAYDVQPRFIVASVSFRF